MARSLGICCILLSMCAGGARAAGGGDPPKHWIYFTDKGFADGAAQSAAIEALADTYSARAIERRRLRRTAPGLFDSRDLPVAAAYRARVEGAGARIDVASRWLNAVSVEADSEALHEIRALPFVARVEPVRVGRRIEPGPVSPADEPGAARSFYGYATEQLTQINLPELHARGYTGAGVVIGILDTGFLRVHEAFNHHDNPLPVVAEWDFIDRDGDTSYEQGDPPDQHVHGTLILGTIRAYKPDELVGGAYDASVILCKTEDVTSETPVEEAYYVAGLEFIEANGGDMATSSLGYIDWYTQDDMDGQTATTTIAVNVATENGVHCCTAAGNQGNDGDPATSHLVAPGDALEVITCGAVSGEGTLVGFSSDGPTADGRVKPEVLAQGADTYTVWPFDTTGYSQASGTSLSTPLVASAVACIVQARPWWTPEILREHLFDTASDFAQFGWPDPLFARGYGIVDADRAAGEYCYVDLDGSGGVNTMDLLIFLNRWAARDDLADFNADGVIDTRDVLAYLNAWSSGCP
ncbi:MAG TPA: S8 family serine peptidase [Phycisphaerales bacterium]|nr:S8 family serine peptidase [Phycisphaerales bacterium]